LLPELRRRSFFVTIVGEEICLINVHPQKHLTLENLLLALGMIFERQTRRVKPPSNATKGETKRTLPSRRGQKRKSREGLIDYIEQQGDRAPGLNARFANVLASTQFELRWIAKPQAGHFRFVGNGGSR
jgi:hypothetical protein